MKFRLSFVITGRARRGLFSSSTSTSPDKSQLNPIVFLGFYSPSISDLLPGSFQEAMGNVVAKVLNQMRLHFYLLLTFKPSTRDLDWNVRKFRFGIPLYFKRTPRLTSTEAHALKYLNAALPSLPIPRLIDWFQHDGATYTIMTYLRGKPLLDVCDDLSRDEIVKIIHDVRDVLQDLWTLKQPASIAGMTMMSASGHGLPDPRTFREEFGGPYCDSVACFEAQMEVYWPSEETKRILSEDPVSWVHTDLRLQNVLVHERRMSGIIDWEDSGWLPRQWQLHVLRNLGFCCFGTWLETWKNDIRFQDDLENAYTTSRPLLLYPL